MYLSPTFFFAVGLWPLSIWLWFTPFAPISIITTIGACVTTIVSFSDQQFSQPDRDQLDGVLDLFAFYTKWEKETDGFYRRPTYSFMGQIRVRDGRESYKIEIVKTNTTIETNGYYTRQFAAKIAALHDANELNVLVNLTKEASECQSLSPSVPSAATH